MKKLITLMTILLILPLAMAGVGSPDTECIDNGFDFGIAKYSCASTIPELGSMGSYYAISVIWTGNADDCTYVSWTSNPAVTAVIEKASGDTIIHSGGTSGEFAYGDHGISHITFCGDKGQDVPEFGTIGAVLALAGAGLYMYKKRK